MSDTVQTEFFQPAFDGVEEFTHSVERVVITLLITERCNYRCSHCLYACSPSRSAAYISDEALQHVGRALHACSGIDDLPVLNILGGEPTLNPTEFSRIVKWITELRPSFRLSMVTNGWWLQSIRRLAQVAAALQPLWGIDEDCLRISISNTIWHDRFRTPRLQKMLRSRALGEVLSRLEEWYPASEVHLLDDSQRQAIAKMAAAAQKEKLYVQCRMDSNSNLIYMGRAEENGLGRRSHLCSAADLSLTVWPDGSIRHICDGAGKMQFGNIEQGIVGFWAVRKEFLARLHRRYNEPWSYGSGNPRCEHCKAYAGYWLSQEKPKFDPDKNICKKPG